MRFKLVFSIDRDKSPLSILPVQYQYPVSCWIYKTIREGNPDYKGWLKKNGFISGRQVFRMFTFSNFLLDDKDYEIHGDRIMLLSDRIELILTSLVDVDISEYVSAIFRGQELSLGDKKSRVFFQISDVIPLNEEISGKSKMKLVSPVVISQEAILEENKLPETFLNPSDEEYKYHFFKNLFEKDQIKNGKNPGKATINLDEIEMEILTDPVSMPTPIKSGNDGSVDIPAYTFEFEIKAPLHLINNGFYGGFGILNSKGFGCAEIVEEEEEFPYLGAY